MKKKPFAFRISESTYQTRKQNSSRGTVNMTEFLERDLTDKEIVVVDGVQELIGELKAIGRNLNQLTTLANMGKVDAVYLAETKAQLSGIYEKLSALCEVKRFENTHEAIITQDIWDISHEVRMHKKRPRKNMENPNPYSGLVFCADCGKPLILYRAHTMDESKNNFACSTYKQYGKETCSVHYIRESQLAAVILDDLKRVTHFARQDEALFAEYINRKNTADTRKEITVLQKELEDMRKRDLELTALFKRLYDDNVLGRIPDEHYRTLSGEYTAEQKILRERIPKAEVRMDKLKSSLTNVDRFIEKAKKYTDLTELTPELLRMFIAKVVVGEKAKKYSRTAPQDIWIHYRDIGMLNDVKEEFDIPSMEEFYGMDDEMMFDDELQAAI
jgi:site-specific DNA recombinase